MSLGEFAIIKRYFTDVFPKRVDVALDIGDDAALCQVPLGMHLAISVDTLVGDVHFPITTPPEDIGYKALAVNLSDLAAMGATPAWMTLALTCPYVDEPWLTRFSQGLLELAKPFQISLIGGDTTRGPLSITIQIMGFVAANHALQRRGARPGDAIYVTGTLGDAGLGLRSLQKRITLPIVVKHTVEARLNRPTPRVQIGLNLRGIASSAIDISDGLLADLGHILTMNHVGAILYLKDLPLSTVLQEHIPRETAWNLALSAGDDYELCFTVPPTQETALQAALPVGSYTRIGVITATPELQCLNTEGLLFTPSQTGYQHF